jgi:formylglycine-generating enzyme required for sulfatase activity
MALILNGEFIRGTTSKEVQKVCLKNNDHCKEKWFEDEEPLHSVKLSTYYLDIREVIQKYYQVLWEKTLPNLKGLTFRWRVLLGMKQGNREVIRGGLWINYSVGVRPSDRTDAKPSKESNFVGFRCAF